MKPTSRCIIAVCAWLGIAMPAVADTFLLPEQGDLVGKLSTDVCSRDDTLPDIARRHDLGFNQIVLANPTVDTWLPGEGTRVTIPGQYLLPNAPRQGLVLNLAEMRLYYYPPRNGAERGVVITHPVGIGREGWTTPTGRTSIVAKIKDPVWIPPQSVRDEHADDGEELPEVVPAGPDNPLGLFALRLAWGNYLIHGTNKPYGIGLRVSHGCVRLYPEDIETLFELLPLGTPVTVVDQAFKTGWHDGKLYLQAYPHQFLDNQKVHAPLTDAVRAVVAASGGRDDIEVDWQKVVAVAKQANGIPVPVAWEKGAAARPAGRQALTAIK